MVNRVEASRFPDEGQHRVLIQIATSILAGRYLLGPDQLSGVDNRVLVGVGLLSEPSADHCLDLCLLIEVLSHSGTAHDELSQG